MTPVETEKGEDEVKIQKREREEVQGLVKQIVGEEEMQPGTS